MQTRCCVPLSVSSNQLKEMAGSNRELCVIVWALVHEFLCVHVHVGIHIFTMRTRTGERIRVPVGGLVYFPCSFLTVAVKLGRGTSKVISHYLN